MFKPKPRLLAIAISAALAPGALQAAVLEEVMVTATKRTESSQDVGIAITAFTGDQLEQLGFTNAQQVTAMAPGVSTVQPNGEANYAIAMRGVANSDFTTNVESPVALYVDEVYISQMSGAGFMLFDMERVEILRGPQGTLFGRNATGGLAHYITRKPTSDFEGYVRGQYGENSQYRVEGAVGGGTDTLSARVSGSYHNNDGYIENRLNRGEDLNDADDYAIRMHIRWAPNDDVALLLTGRKSDQDIRTGFFENVSSVLPGQLTPGVPNPVLGGYVDTDGDVWAGDYDEPGFNDLQTDGLTATLTWDFESFRLTSITDRSNVDRNYIEDTDASPVNFAQFFLTTDAQQTSQEIRFDGETDRFQWVGGFYYLDLDIDDSNGIMVHPLITGELPEDDGPELGFNNPYSSQLESYSVFGQLDIPLGEAWTLIAGARYIDDDKDFKYRIDVTEFQNQRARNFNSPTNAIPLETLATYSGNADDQEWSARLQLEWAFNDDWLLYGGWNRGVKGGGFNAPIFPLSPPLDYNDQTMAYDPEKLDAFEVGFKSTLFDGIMQFNGAAYYYDYKDYQAFFIVGIDTITFNTDAESYGAEVELQASPLEGLDILLGAAYNDIDVELPTGDVPSVQSPEWNLNGLLRYEWPMLGGLVAIQGDIQYRDEHYFALTNIETVEEDGYWLSNASLSYTTDNGKWQGTVFVNNLTDEEYLVQTFDLSSLDVFGITEQYYGRPRWWGASIQYNWGP
jgi:iron complex outermembrane receptor protein